MNSAKKKNFRAFLFDQSVSPEILSPKKNLFRQSQKLSSSKNSKIEYSNSLNSNNLTFDYINSLNSNNLTY